MVKKICIYIIAVIISMFAITTVKAEDLSEYFSIDNIKICANASCTSYYDEDNGVTGSNIFAVKFDWHINSDVAINDGDIIKIPFANEIETENQTRFNCLGFSWSDIYDENSNKIGQWMMDGNFEDRVITIKLSDNAISKTSLGGTFITAKNISSDYGFVDKVVPLTVGNKKAYLKIKPKIRDEILENASMITTGTSNNSAGILMGSPHITIKQLYDVNAYPNITSSAMFNDLYAELLIPEYLNASIDKLIIRAIVVAPISLTEMKAASGSYTIPITSDFTEIQQNAGETYNEFKTRMQEFEYGFFKEGNNNSIIVNFGSQPSRTKTYEYYSKLIDSSYSGIGDYFHSLSPFSVDSTVKDVFNNVFGNSNRVGGKVVFWGLSVKLRFPTVAVPTTKQINGIWTWNDIDGNAKQQQVSTDVKLVVPSSIATISEESKLLLRDFDSKTEIVGAKIKLQKKDGDSYVDVGEAITDSSGVVTFRNLESGVYRYVQTGYLDYYKNNSFKMYSDNNLSNIISTFEFDSSIGNIVYATNERERFSVTYLPGEHGNFNDIIYSDILYGDATPNYEATSSDGWLFKGWSPERDLYVTENKTYTALWKKMVKVTTKYLEEQTNTPLLDDVIDIDENDTEYRTVKKDIDNYEFVRVEGVESGSRGENDIVVTYYYKKKESNLNIKYLDCSSRSEIASSTNLKLYYGDNYNSDNYEVNITIPNNYNRASANKTDNYKGIVSSDSINVEYCYNKKDSLINSSIAKSGTDTITTSKDKLSYQINYNTVFTDYIGEASITVVDTLPFKIDVNISNLDGGVYDDNNKTITWNINTAINSYENSEYKVTKNIELSYINIDATKDAMSNHVIGQTVIDGKTTTAETSYNSYIDIKGTINVSYVDDSGKELLDKVTTTDKVGKTYELIEQSIEGYKIVNKPKEKIHEYKEEIQNLEYTYERLKYKIVTKALNEGGSITGDEEVYYGENSKENNINIEANDGYYISKITINDKEIKIPEKQTKLIIPNFIKMNEDKNINVEFKKYSTDIVVPNTLKNSILKTIGIIVVLFSIGFILYTLYKRKVIFNK